MLVSLKSLCDCSSRCRWPNSECGSECTVQCLESVPQRSRLHRNNASSTTTTFYEFEFGSMGGVGGLRAVGLHERDPEDEPHHDLHSCCFRRIGWSARLGCARALQDARRIHRLIDSVRGLRTKAIRLRSKRVAVSAWSAREPIAQRLRRGNMARPKEHN